MLKIIVPAREMFDPKTQSFVYTKEQKLSLEHSLISISKWESKWHKPYLKKDYKMTYEEYIDYVKCMTITSNVDPMVYKALSVDNAKEINAYVNDPHTAATFTDRNPAKGGGEVVTSETIYYWMTTYGIPFDPCEKWHLNRLLTLIRFCNIKNGNNPKMSNREILAENKALNEMRRAKMKSRG